MITQHTPGPWRLGLITGGDARPVEDEAYLDMGNEDDGSHCEIELSGTNAPANARLIAAAPDLLAALRPLAAWFDDFTAKPTAADCRRAHAAIAKAEGRT